MTDYYGRVGKARKDYLNPDKRNDERGTFGRLLENTINVYGKKKYTEEGLVKIFGDYIVDNFIPSPKIELWGTVFPLSLDF